MRGPVALLMLVAGCAVPHGPDRTASEQDLGLELGSELSSALARASGPLPEGYAWPVPAGWSSDVSPLPPPFQPRLAVHGREEVRLAPGYLERGSPDFRTSGFVWWLPRRQGLGAAALSDDLTEYDRARIAQATGGAPVDPSRVLTRLAPLGDFAQGRPVRIFAGGVDAEGTFTRGASIELTPPRMVRVFTGRSSTLDARDGSAEVRLHLLVSVFDCPAASHTVVLVLASPQPLRGALWRGLVDQAGEFRCR